MIKSSISNTLLVNNESLTKQSLVTQEGEYDKRGRSNMTQSRMITILVHVKKEQVTTVLAKTGQRAAKARSRPQVSPGSARGPPLDVQWPHLKGASGAFTVQSIIIFYLLGLTVGQSGRLQGCFIINGRRFPPLPILDSVLLTMGVWAWEEQLL